MYSAKSILTGVFCVAIIAQLSLVMFYSKRNPDPSATTTGESTNSQENTRVGNEKVKTESIAIASDSSVDVDGAITAKTSDHNFETGSKTQAFSDGNPRPNLTVDGSKKASEDGAGRPKIERTILRSSEIEELVRRTCVQIFDRDSGDQGTGVVVEVSDNGFEVLTACHVVKRATAISVFAFEQEAEQWVRREYRTVELVRCDEDSDLARIRIRTPIAHLSAISTDIFAESAEKKFLGNERLAWTVSWTDDGKPVANECKIADRRMAQRNATARPIAYWVLKSPSEPGMSGGPLLSTRGELIGIASGNSGGNAFYTDEFEISRFSIGPPSSKND